jgi:acyl-CoA synthetase (AMP-forming)/AMP-acid ligase II
MPVKSPYPDFEIPDLDIWSFLFERKDRDFPEDKTLFVDADTQRSYTFAQLRDSAVSFAHGLKSTWNWKKGDVLAIFSPNCVDTPAIMYGVAWTGGVVTPANPTYTVDELAFQLSNSESKALATQRPLLPIARAAAKKAGLPEDRIILIGDERDPNGIFKHFTSIRNISGTTRFRRQRIDPKKDVAYLAYSSGTTGLPKGVMLSHRNMVANVLQCKNTEGRYLSWNGNADGQGDRMLGLLPFFHIYGLTCILHTSVHSGYSVFVMPKFEIEKFCSHVQNYRITFIFVAPPVILLLGKHPVVEKYDLSSLRMLNSGAAPLTRELVLNTSARIKVPIKQGYGLTETSPTTHTQIWEDWDKDIGSVGQLHPNMEARYMTTPEDDSAPQEVPVGQVGELWMRGPNIFLGYHKNKKATDGCLTADGWFMTGDVGYQDKDGKFFITDRIKELIKYKGFQVAPAELEGILLDNELIDDVAVIGVYSEEHGCEIPRAYVVRSAASKASSISDADEAAKIVAWIHDKVAQHKRLRGGVRFVDAIPKSVSGKILRRVLKEQAKKEDEKPKAKL